MKRIAGLLGGLMLAASVCSATIPKSEMAIGGIVPGMTRDQVVQIYGEPTKEITHVISTRKGNFNEYEMQYGTSFFCWYSYSKNPGNEGEYRIDIIKTTANNGLGTPAGLMVGQPVSRMLELYGKPDRMGDKSYGRYGAEANEKTLKRFSRGIGTASYLTEGLRQLYIKAKNDKISSIEVLVDW